MRSVFDSKAAQAALMAALAILAAAPFGPAAASDGPTAALSPVTLTTINCIAQSQISKPTIVVRDVSSGRGPTHAVVPATVRADPSLSVTTFAMVEGTYTVMLTQGGCSDIFDLTILPDARRNIAIAPNRGVFVDYHSHNSLAGILPFLGLRADLLLCAERACDTSTLTGFDVLPVTVDGQAYYANQLPPASWYLRLYFSSGCKSVLVPIQGADKSGMQYTHLRRDVSAGEIQTLWSQQRTLRRGCQ